MITPSPSPATPAPPQPLAAWLQFPRRAVLLLLAYALGLGLLFALRGLFGGGLVSDWSTSVTTLQPVAEIVGERFPTTLGLLLLALVMALLLAAVGTLLGVGLRRLGAGVPAAGVGAGCLVRVFVYGLAAVPPFVLVLIFVFAVAVQLGLLPGTALFGSGGGPVRSVLPALLLSWFPALVTAQAALRVLAEPGPLGRRLARAAFTGLGTLLTQTGGLITALVPVEVILAWPGLGRALVQSLAQRDLPVFAGILLLFVGWVLVARLIAEAFFALARLVGAEPAVELSASPAPQSRRRAGLVVSLALLLLPLAVIVAGLATPPERATEMSLADRGQPPSDAHPWGTDSLGRDLQARVLRGALTTLGLALGAGLLATVPAVLVGALTSRLARRRQLAAESLADLLLLPADAWLLIPSLLAGLLVVLLIPAAGSAVLVAAAVLALFPRAARAAHALWTTAPNGLPRARRLIAGFAGVFLAAVWAGLWLLTALEMLGFGVPPPAPSLGSLLTEGLSTAAQQSASLLAPSLVVWLCAVALYTAAVAVLGVLRGKAAAGWFNA